MTPIKESAEVASASGASESAQTKSRSKPESPHLRADAVSLDVPVKVHGSVLPGVTSGAGPAGIGQAQPFEEQTSTMIVFPQGSVLKMSTGVSAGQVMVLTNLKSRQDAICRVVKVRAYGAGQSYVEIEFTSPQPGYWGVYFPSDGPEVARMPQQQAGTARVASAQDSAAPSAPVVSQPMSAPSIDQKISEVLPTVAPAPPVAKSPEPAAAGTEVQQSPVTPARPATAKMPESSFASIGTQEEVLAPADAMREKRAGLASATSINRSPSADRETSDGVDSLAGRAARAVPTARAESQEFGAAAAIPENSSPPHGRLQETRSVGPKQMFGVTLGSELAVEKSSEGKGKLWIATGVAAAIVVAAGAAYYFRFRPSLNRMASVAPAATSAAAPAAQRPSAQPSAPQTAPASVLTAQPVPDQSASRPSVPQTPEVAPAAEAPGDAAAQSSSPAVDSGPKSRRPRNERPDSAIRQQPSVAIPSAFGALNTRPVVANHDAASAGAAPALTLNDAPMVPNGSLPAIAVPSPAAPASPKPVSNVPVRVGGKILPPRLISSVLPVYPEIARQAGVTGTIVIDTTIDQHGNVAKMRVISGPELLRQAAVSALRQWKYEPSRLNGQKISTEMIVSIQFH